MIKSKKDYLFYLQADRMAIGSSSHKKGIKSLIVGFFLPDYRRKYQTLMRKIEYRKNCKRGIFNKILLFFLNVRYHRLGLKLLINIYPNTCGPGLSIAHHGPIRISKGVKIGNNCRIHISTNIGIQAGTEEDSAIIGDNVYIGPGVKFVKPCIIGDSVAIGANSVVTSSFSEGNVTIAGIPAKVVRKQTDTRKILIPATELLEKGIFDTNGKTNLEIFKITLSIIIPSFNKADFIRETLNSVRHQTFDNWEAIVVDDGSTDNSIAIIKEYCSKDSRIQFVKREQEPKGGSACRNIGIEHAKGTYIIFLDADDILASNCLQSRLDHIESYTTNDFWVFPIGTFYKKIRDSASVWKPKGQNFLHRFLKHDLPWHTMSVIWKKTYLKKLGGFHTDYPRLQDVELHTRALLVDDVKLKTFPHAALDAYYRIDEKRTIENLEQKLTKQLRGVMLYMENISPLLNLKKQKKAIKGTLFSFITSLNYSCIIVSRDDLLHQRIIREVILFMNNNNLFKNKDISFINLYIKLYGKGFWKIKGFNYVMKYLFTGI